MYPIGELMNTRQLKILERISQDKKIEVNQLSDLFDVSAVTIRKDLDTMEALGLLKREHGFAMINHEDNIHYRLALGYQDKQHIALKALELIKAHETVMIESGSSCTLLALELAKRNQNNTIITNSCFIARYLKAYPLTKVILLGGSFQAQSEANVGPLIQHSLTPFHVHKLFIGTDGIDQEHGFTGSDFERSETVKLMRQHCDELYVLSRSHKLHSHASYQLFDLSDVTALISDDHLTETDQTWIQTYCKLL
jgi:DeoR/GlpR family transcriptional regulator of sugar metabolism